MSFLQNLQRAAAQVSTRDADPWRSRWRACAVSWVTTAWSD
jgi:hypothetical protein